MRHLKRKKTFNRDKDHRKAMFTNMMVSFFNYGKVKTTVAKAKELRRLSEKQITRAKVDSLHNRRIVLSRLKDRDIVAKLFDEIAPKYKNVNGGYTRIIRLNKRKGDGADLSTLELIDVDYTEKKRKGKKEAVSSNNPS